MMDLSGRVALVTGASRNIGRAIALALAEQGADVVINTAQARREAESVAEEVRTRGRRALVCAADVTDEAAVTAMAEQVQVEFGRVDVLVLNASIRPESPFLQISYAEWRRVIDLSLDGAFYSTQAFLPGMVERGWGRIITLGGVAAQRGAANRAHIAAGKGGLQGFTRALAVELGRTGVTVNMVAPGAIDTVRVAPAAGHGDVGRGSPVGRMGLPEEVAAACIYLASSQAAYVTGQTLNVNGGALTS